MLAFIKGVVAIANAIPALKQMLEMLFDEWTKYQVNQLTNHHRLETKKAAHVRRKIREAKTDEERIVFSIILNDLNNRRELQR